MARRAIGRPERPGALYTRRAAVLGRVTPVSLLSLHSAQPGAGKSTVAVGLAGVLQRSGASVRLERSAGDDTAADDARTFAQVEGVRSTGRPAADPASFQDTDVTIVEAAGVGGAPSSHLGVGSAAIIVSRSGESDGPALAALIEATGAAGLIVTAAPPGTTDDAMAARARALHLPLLGWLPQDRLLAAPLIAGMAAAVGGELSGAPELHDEAVEWLQVGPISAHPGSDHFGRYPDQAVVTRHDKIDVALAALDAGAVCLILSGGAPSLPYVAQRAESEEFALIITPLATPEAVNRIGALYGRSAFRGARKRERARALLEPRVDLAALRALLA